MQDFYHAINSISIDTASLAKIGQSHRRKK